MSRASDGLNAQMDEGNGFTAEPVENSALAALNRSEIDMQISTAKRYPRSITRAKQKMIEMATLDTETAQGCIYVLKRKDKSGRDAFIEGPSVRLAEIAVHAWGNIRAGARVIGEDGNFIIAQGVCHDLETNTFTSLEVRRRITKSNGQKYGDDMIGVTANAACAIAFRNAVYKVIPRVFINPAYEKARSAVSGDIKTIGVVRQGAIDSFSKIYVTLDQLLAYLEKPEGAGLDDIGREDLITLSGLLTAIRDGDTSVEEQFPPPDAKPRAAASGAAGLNKTLDEGRAAPAPQPKATPPSPAPPAAAVPTPAEEKAPEPPASAPAPQAAPVAQTPPPVANGGEASKPAATDVPATAQETPEFDQFKAGIYTAMADHGLTDEQQDAAWRRMLLAAKGCAGSKGDERRYPKEKWAASLKAAVDQTGAFAK